MVTAKAYYTVVNFYLVGIQAEYSIRMECYPPNINRRILPYFDTCLWIISFEFIVEVYHNDLCQEKWNLHGFASFQKNSTLLLYITSIVHLTRLSIIVDY